MNVAIVGTGYVGLVTGTCLAEMGNTVMCVDVDDKKIKLLKDGLIPIYEPGLAELVKDNVIAKRLHFTTDIRTALNDCEVIMIAVGTPPNEDGSADLKHVLKVAESIGQNMTSHKIVVTKSTVPVGTGEKVKSTIKSELQKRGSNVNFSIASNPEFLKEGAAIQDWMKPDRIVVGCDDDFAKQKLAQLYQPFVLNGHKVIFMDIRSAELTKYAANAMLATKISFMNELSRLAEKVDADIAAVRQGIGSDTRIGFHFIYPGIGYGGSCFPKDVQALMRMGQDNNSELAILNAVEAVNKSQRQFFLNKVKRHFKGDLRGKHLAIWGLSFKPETDDIREAPALDIISDLIQSGATITAHDPIAAENVREFFAKDASIKGKLQIEDDQYQALGKADAMLLLTEWKPFRSPDFAKMKQLMKSATIFDGRNQYDPSVMKQNGFYYECIGRQMVRDM